MLRLFSPAKINLFFKLIGLRNDGFHQLESFFQAVSLGDDLTLSRSSQDQFISNDTDLIQDPSNTILKALKLFRQKTSIFDPVQVELVKRIPKQAGLGGGSSNAATMLWGLNVIFGTKIDDQTLLDWGKEIGSDVPFFFSYGSALCKGRGEEIIHAAPPNLVSSVWIVKPPFALSTKEVYTFSKKKSKIAQSLETLMQKIYTPEPILENDLEEAAFLLCPHLALLKDELLGQDFSQVFMTGSGSSYVCIGSKPPKCKNTVQIFPVKYINRLEHQWY